MFDRIAPTYDVLNHTLSANIDRLWRRRVVRCAAAGAPRRILDLATGTGDLALALARAVPGAQVLGLDLSMRACCSNGAMPSIWRSPTPRSMR